MEYCGCKWGYMCLKILRNASLPSLLFSRRDDRKWILPWVKGTQGLSCFSGRGDRSFCAVCAFLSLVPSSRCCKLKRAQVAYLRHKAVSLPGKLITGKKEVLILSLGSGLWPSPLLYTECPPWHRGPQTLGSLVGRLLRSNVRLSIMKVEMMESSLKLAAA